MRTLLLFDIDGTLILTGGAGVRAMNRAFEETFRVRDGFAGISMGGRVDSEILAGALARASIPQDDPEACLGRFRERYCELLREEIQMAAAGKGVMPGVRELVPRLKARRDVALGLLTGNFRVAAEIKLEHFRLWEYFAFGAFGEDALERPALVPIAIERARRAGYLAFEAARVVIVGDTPHDVMCARAHGAKAIAVATGSYTASDLREAGAETVFDDLTDIDAFLALLETWSTSPGAAIRSK